MPHDIQVDSGHVLSIRRCPNPDCRAVVYTVRSALGAVRPVDSHPSELLEFNPEGVPEAVVSAMEEALQNHAHGCYVSAALMVRKTLEVMCADQRAQGTNLKARVDALSDSLVLPRGFTDAIHNLRLLGNDAAHVEARTYDEVGQEEVEISIEVVQTLLRACYQQQNLLDRLGALKTSQGGDA